jgi:hypothetical protein
MGMETLNNAARAAGFAMAASDEPYEEVKTEAKVEATGWRPSEAKMLAAGRLDGHHKAGDWFRTMLGLFGRRAPASPA